MTAMTRIRLGFWACLGLLLSNSFFAASAFAGGISTCNVNGDCPTGSYCAKAPGDCDGTGTCVQTPPACPAIFDPVCGCDGFTYDNDCFAAQAGVSVASRGMCQTPTCSTNGDCGPGEYCSKREGDCDGVGICSPTPAICPLVFDPVCGCDGVTYDNDCFAAQAGVSVAQPGSCPITCSSNNDCGAGLYCSKSDGDCDGLGICIATPDLCLEIFDPVCGCDGVTYDNACFAGQAGVSLAQQGECPVFDCSDNCECDAGFYCSKAEGDCDGPGTCTEQPPACPLFFDPVCGCDGVTYSNSCFAARAGVSLIHQGPCLPPSCDTNGDCPISFYCAKDDGDCSGVGVCEPTPFACPEIFDPVCGCDGVSYDNDCFSATAGVNVAHAGQCLAVECGTNNDCDLASYCAKPDGDCSGLGACAPLPLACPQVFDPVCGCNGATYSNACFAAQARVSVSSSGACPPPSCSTNNDCDPGLYCAKSEGDCDGEGTCTPTPDMCPEIFDPVCGCDGQTYDNDCFAAAAGVSVASEGVCRPPTCLDNCDCEAGFYCAKAEGDCDGAGVCTPKPEACPDVFDPVCGCDGVTYGNDCEAAAVGVSISSRGECPPPSCNTNNDCDPGFYCQKREGDCDGPGVCTPTPVACPDVFDPVCGCDGVTYSNDCDAAAVGVSVDRRGECEPQGPQFVRADANGDGRVNIADPSFIANAIFSSGAPQPPCDEAADANDDGGINIADPSFIANAIFLSGFPQPPLPFPDCGPDPNPPGLGCVTPPATCSR